MPEKKIRIVAIFSETVPVVSKGVAVLDDHADLAYDSRLGQILPASSAGSPLRFHGFPEDAPESFGGMQHEGKLSIPSDSI